MGMFDEVYCYAESPRRTRPAWHVFSDEISSRSVHVPLSDHKRRTTDRLC